MNDEEKETLQMKLVDLLNGNEPKPDILESIEILRDIESAFLGHLDENMSKFSLSEENE